MDTEQEGEDETNWENNIDILSRACVKWIDSGNMLGSIGSSARCSVMTERGGRSEWGRGSREGDICIHTSNHNVVEQKLTRHGKATIYQ